MLRALNSMIIFAATREGYKELESIILTAEYPVWIGAGLLTSEEMDSVRERGVYLTNFFYKVDLGNKEVVSEALDNIALHHPDERVWMEIIP